MLDLDPEKLSLSTYCKETRAMQYRTLETFQGRFHFSTHPSVPIII